MIAAYASAQYRENEVQTTPGKLVVMLYDGALRFLQVGLEALRGGDLETRATNLGKAQRILCELIACLDLRAGDMASDLYAIYRFCLERLLRAHAEDNEAYIEEVIRTLASLRDAWDQAERSLRTAQYEAGAPALVGASG
jgi:flagellar protein FliS